VTTSISATVRTPLSRERILEEALRFVDEHGLDALSMHKLGARLGVKGMSLYNHVQGKDDVLDGLVETMWAEIEDAAPATVDWRQGFRGVGHAIRDTVRGHPRAAVLLTSRALMPEAALRTVRDHIAAAVAAGEPVENAHALLRTVTTYALGTALAYCNWEHCGVDSPPTVGGLLRPDVSEELAAVAHVFCGQADPDAQFELGLDLMLRPGS
jgi:TetR/AcrR family tetracycline transcriptional repressor